MGLANLALPQLLTAELSVRSTNIAATAHQDEHLTLVRETHLGQQEGEGAGGGMGGGGRGRGGRGGGGRGRGGRGGGGRGGGRGRGGRGIVSVHAYS